MKDINIKFIPQERQRYAVAGQIGDYWETETAIEFRVTEFDDPVYSMAVLMHELHEKFRNNMLGIKDEDVDLFDLLHAEVDDCGVLPDAPYHKTHMEADAIERLFILLCGEDWTKYEEAATVEIDRFLDIEEAKKGC